MLRIIVCLSFALCLSFSPSNAQADNQNKIVVSVPPLHSLVSALVQGVATPTLLFTSEKDFAAAELSADQLAKIEQSEMFIWVGPEHETQLLQHRLHHPELTQKELTLTDSLPVFHKPLIESGPNSEMLGDMKFWLDPKLVKMAVSRIAASLVNIYPDQLETILDNEIELKNKLHRLNKKMHDVLKADKSVPLNIPKSDVLYLAWRFNLQNPNCATAAKKLLMFQGQQGVNHYFEIMEEILEDLRVCQLYMT